MATTNLNLDKVTNSQTVADFLAAFNGNMDKLDALPIPVGSGSNSQLSYLKLADGTLVMWGLIDHGSRYPFDQSWGTASDNYHGYHSDPWTVSFPVPFVGTNPVVHATAEDSYYAQVFIIKNGAWTTESASFCYWSTAQHVAASTRKAHILLIGRWK